VSSAPGALVDRADHHAVLRQEVARLLETSRTAVGADGRVAWLDERCEPDAGAGQQLWITTRMTHVLSLSHLLARGHLLGAADDGRLATLALQSVDREFEDAEFGGWYRSVPPSGPPEPAKTAYEHAFVLLAASSGVVAGLPGAADLLDRAMAVVLEHFWDDDAGLLVESWSRDWTVAEAYRGANANMHAVEAFLATADATGDDVWRHRADRIARGIVAAAELNDWRIPEHYDQRWRALPDYNLDQPRHAFRPYGATPGHGFEWARLLLQLGGSRAGSTHWVRPAAEALFAQAADSWDAQRGGFPYTTDWSGVAVVEERFHWVHCEALAAAAMLWRVTSDPVYAQWYERIWDYTWPLFPDPVGGGWWHELDPQGQLSLGTWRGKPDTYHAIQACLSPTMPVGAGFALGVAAPRTGP